MADCSLCARAARTRCGVCRAPVCHAHAIGHAETHSTEPRPAKPHPWRQGLPLMLAVEQPAYS